MLKEALDRLLKLSRAGTEVIKVNDLPYSVNNGNGGFAIVNPPMTPAIEVQTLSGLLGLITSGVNGHDGAKLEKDYFLHVVDHDTVNLVALASNEFGQREIVATADAPNVEEYPFGQYVAPEIFAIYLQSRFEPTDDLLVLQSVIGRLTSETVATSADDGITQTVALKKGAALKTEVTLKPRVTLAPFRTFAEIEQQPRSEFIFRLKQFEAEQPPKLALFEADGGAWKVDAMRYIREHLTDQTKVKVVA
jgi:hypothetical protein